MHGHWLKGYLRDGKEIEGGGGGSGGGGSLIVNIDSNLAADKTFGEIQSALDSGMMVFFKRQPRENGPYTFSPISGFMHAPDGTHYGAMFFEPSYSASSVSWSAWQSTNANATTADYPVFTDGST